MTTPVEMRLKKPVRGWYKDPDPGFHAVNKNFKKLDEKDAIKAACAKFALLNESGEPVEQLTRILQKENFGYSKKQPTTNYRFSRPVIFGPKGPQASGFRPDQQYGSGLEPYGGV